MCLLYIDFQPLDLWPISRTQSLVQLLEGFEAARTILQPPLFHDTEHNVLNFINHPKFPDDHKHSGFKLNHLLRPCILQLKISHLVLVGFTMHKHHTVTQHQRYILKCKLGRESQETHVGPLQSPFSNIQMSPCPINR